MNISRVPSGFGKNLRLLAKTPSGKVGIGLTSALLVIGVLSPFIAPFPPTATTGSAYAPPSFTHLLGTDDLGEDIFSELIWAARGSLLVAITAGAVSSLLGVTVGLFSGYYGGRSDELL